MNKIFKDPIYSQLRQACVTILFICVIVGLCYFYKQDTISYDQPTIRTEHGLNLYLGCDFTFPVIFRDAVSMQVSVDWSCKTDSRYLSHELTRMINQTKEYTSYRYFSKIDTVLFKKDLTTFLNTSNMHVSNIKLKCKYF